MAAVTNISLSNFCACMGPLHGDPYCPCEMRARGLPFDDSRLKWSEDDKKRLHDFLKMMADSEKENKDDVPTSP